MLEVRKAPESRTVVRETWWLGDPAIDRERSSVEEWTRTGETSGLVSIEGAKPSVIRWRPLTESEVLYLSTDRAHAMDRALDAFRLGLVSIDGVHLGRVVDHRRSVVDLPTTDALMGLVTRVSWRQVLNAWLEADPLFRSSLGESEGEGLVSLPLWLGAVILAETFRGGA